MIQKIKSAILSLGLLFVLATPVALPASVSAANIQGNLCKGSDLRLVGNECVASDQTNSFNDTLTKIINIFSVIVGIIAVIMIIIGGFRYITSGGASDKVKGAKDTLLYAIIGLIIVALAQVIVRFVLNQST